MGLLPAVEFRTGLRHIQAYPGSARAVCGENQPMDYRVRFWSNAGRQAATCLMCKAAITHAIAKRTGK